MNRFVNANLDYLNIEIPSTEIVNEHEQKAFMQFNTTVKEQKLIDDNTSNMRRIELDDYYRWRNI